MDRFFLRAWKELKDRFDSFFGSSGVSSDHAKAKYRMLCVDDDRDFCRYIEQLASSMEIKIDKAYSIKEAKTIIEGFSDYHAYIIDGHLPDGSGFDLIAWMREVKRIDAPIGFLSRIYQDAVSFRRLKEVYRVKYVLDKPLLKEAVFQFLKQLIGQEELTENFPDAVLDELKEKYDRTVFDKVDKLEKLILDLQKSPTSENLLRLKEEVHKIGGSAGSYGYTDVSRLCKALEEEIAVQIPLSSTEGIDPAWLFSLDRFFTRIKLRFQMPLSKEL